MRICYSSSDGEFYFSLKVYCIYDIMPIVLSKRRNIMNLPTKFTKTFIENLKKYQPILRKMKENEVNETDTVKVINDILSDLFGYDKYSDITSEYAIRGTYCDLAIKGSNNKPYILIEVKGISIALNDNHIKQTIDYGANEGVKWCVLTNGEYWKVYLIKFAQPIDKELVFEFNLLDLNVKDEKMLSMIFALSKLGKEKSVIEDLYSEIQVKNKYIIGALLNSGDVFSLIRKNMRKLFDDIKISEEEISSFVRNDIIRRDIIDTDEAKKAVKDIEKRRKKLENKIKKDQEKNSEIDKKEV